MADAKIKAVITAEDRASATLNNFGKKVGKFGALAKVGLLAAAGAATAFGVASVKSFTESEDSIAQLNAVLKSTKGVAGVTAKSAVNLADSLQKVTRYSDETILGGENLLLTFTKIGKDIFPQATEVMLDMSTALGQDLKSSAIQLGKALQDPERGITALRRVGVNFNSQQTEMVKKLVETGRQAEAQKYILKELQTEFGGSAKAAGETFGGKLTILKNLFDELMEKVGGFIAKALTPLVNGLSALLSPTGQANEKLTMLKNIFDGIVKVVQQLITYYNVYSEAFTRVFKDNWEKSIKPALTELWTTLKTQLMPALKELWVAVSPVLIPALKALGTILGVVVVGSILVLAKAMTIGAKISTTLYLAMARIIQTMRAWITPIYTISRLMTTLFVNAIKQIITWIGNLIKKFYFTPQIKAALSGVYHAIVDPFLKAFNKIKSEAQGAVDAVKRLANNPVVNPVGAIARKLQGKASGTEFFRPKRYAGGTGSASGGMALVGERGAELVTMPRGAKVHRADETRKMMGGVTNINITVPMMTGSANERRKVARMLIKDIQDIAQMNGKSVTDMMSSNYGLVT